MAGFRGPGRRSPSKEHLATAAALAVWGGLVAVAHRWGTALNDQGRNILLHSPPIFGDYRGAVPAGLVPAALVAAVLVTGLPVVAARARWRWAVALTIVAAAAWWAVVAAVDGAAGFTAGLEWEREWAPAVTAAAADARSFLSSLVTSLSGYSVQVRGHPPGFVLLGAALTHLGGTSPTAMASVVIGAGLTIVATVAGAVRRLAGEDAARRVLPFLALTPAAPFLVTSPDTLTAAVAAGAVLLAVVAVTTTGRRAPAAAAGAGILAAAAVLLSYGMVLMACVPAAVARAGGRVRPLVLAGAVGTASVAALALAGYWWPAGLAATRHEYDTLGLDRPYGYFLVANLAAGAVALGPAVAVALARLRDRRVWALAGGGLAAALVADLSGLSEGEVERIWLPFSVWVLTAAAALVGGRRRCLPGGWLVLQAASTITLIASIRPTGEAAPRHERTLVRVLVTGGAGFIGSHVVDAAARRRPRGRRARLAPAGRARRPSRTASTTAPSTAGATSATPTPPRAPSPASTPCATRRARGRPRASTSPTCRAYVDHNDAGHGRAAAGRSHDAGFTGRLVLAAAWWSTARAATAAPSTAPCGPGPAGRADLDAGRFEPAVPALRPTAGAGPVDEDAPADPRNVYAATKLHQEHLCRGVRPRARQRGRRRCATTTSTDPGCPATRPMPASPASSAAAARGGAARRGCSRTAASAATSSTSTTSPGPTWPRSPRRAAPSGAYNVASGEPRTVLDLAEAVAAGADRPGGDAVTPRVVGGFRVGDVRHVVASPARARRKLGFGATTSFAAGMDQFATAPLRS